MRLKEPIRWLLIAKIYYSKSIHLTIIITDDILNLNSFINKIIFVLNSLYM